MLSFSINAQNEDNIGWLFIKHKNIPLDTQAHMLGGFTIGGASSLYWRERTDSGIWGVVGGTTSLFAFGLFKEWLDVKKGGQWSWNDIGWGTGSAFVGSVVFNLRADSVQKSREIERLQAMIEADEQSKSPLEQ